MVDRVNELRRSSGVLIGSAVGILLACLWGVHAAAPAVPGRWYVRFPLILVLLAAFLTCTQSARSRGRASKSGLVAGLCCWFTAATLSTILNWRTEEVLPTYVFVFLTGAGLYWVLSRVRVTPRDLDIAIVGLALGSLVPLVNGLSAFVAEWGTPDAATAVSAWKTQLRMATYEAATFGNRGNTAAFLLLVAPMLFSILFDRRKHKLLRAFSAAVLVPIGLNLMILQVRAAYVVLFAALAITWTFRRGVKWLPLLAVGVAFGWLFLFQIDPEAGQTMVDRMVPAITVDSDADESVQERVEAINEGWVIAERNWLLGIGPGGALTIHSRDSAHQFHVQQAMETGVLGFIGSILFTFGVWGSLLRTLLDRRDDETNEVRFVLLIGPASFFAYSAIANAALNNSDINTWTVLAASMLALTPAFTSRRLVIRADARNPRRTALELSSAPASEAAIVGIPA